MGVDTLRIGVEVRRFLVLFSRTCYRTVRRHPFLAGLVCYLIFLYKAFPLLFSFLVSASPVLICTAILLGTLLSFGEPNVPEIEKEKDREEEVLVQAEVSHEISSFKSGVLEDSTVVVGRDGSFTVERFTGKEMKENVDGDHSLLENKVNRVEADDDGLGDYMPLGDESPRDIHSEKEASEEVERGFDSLGNKRKIQEEILRIEEVLDHDEVVGNQYSLAHDGGDEDLEGENERLHGEFTTAENGNHLDFFENLQVKQENDDENEEDSSSDSGSDRAESSSPDASMADILPLLDELHPLLDEETLQQPAHKSHDGSDTGSEQSHKSKERNVNDMEKHTDEEGCDDNNNEEDEEEAHEGKEDESKSAIVWTEDDQKNLMNVGTSELERNLRLEGLVARRRARRNLRSMAERNLIDLDSADLPVSVPPISTVKRNPFDLLNDDDIPSSAPSILMPRRNPFDLPCESSEEKLPLKGDDFHQEFSAFQHREAFFRRHEGFSIGPSALGSPKQERQDLRWKPYFLPEQFAREGNSYPTFQRQLSEVSESKVSSIPDTESVSSVVEEDKKLNEECTSEDTELISSVDRASLLVERGSLSSEDIADLEKVEEKEIRHDEDETTPGGDIENQRELDSSLSMSGGTSPTELNTTEILLRMGAGEEEYSSRSSLSSLSEIDEKISAVNREPTSLEQRNVEVEEACISPQTSVDSDFHFLSGMAGEYQQHEPTLEPRDIHFGESTSNVDFKSGFVDGNQQRECTSDPQTNNAEDSGISKQTLLESDLQCMTGVTNEHQYKEPALEAMEDDIGEPGISTETTQESDLHFSGSVVDEAQQNEPVYDLSPSVKKLISVPSVSADKKGEILEMGSPSPVAELADKESEVHTDGLEDISGYEEMQETSSQVSLVDGNESRPREVIETVDLGITKAGPAGFVPNFDVANELVKPESVVEDVLVDSPPSSSDNGTAMEDVAFKEESSHHNQCQMDSSSLDTEFAVETHQDEMENMDSALSGLQMATELKEHHSPIVIDHDLLDPKLFYSETELLDENAMGMEEIVQDQVCSFISEPVDLNVSVYEERKLAVVSDRSMEDLPDVSSLDMKHVEHQVDSSNLDKELTVETSPDEMENLDSASSGSHMTSQLEEQHSLEIIEHQSAETNLFCSVTEPLAECAMGTEETLHVKHDQAQPSILEFVDLNEPAHEESDPEVVTEQATKDHLDTSSLHTEHEGEHSLRKEENLHLHLDLELSSTTDDLNVCAKEESEHAVVAEQATKVHQDTSLQTGHEEEHSAREEETLHLDLDQVVSPTDAKIDEHHQDVDVKVVSLESSYQHVPSEGSSSYELEKQQSWSDKSMVEPSFGNHDHFSEPSEILEESVEKMTIPDKVNIPESDHTEDNMSRHITSSISDSALVPPVSLEFKTSTSEINLKENFLDKVVYEDSGHVIEHFNHSAEAYNSPLTDSTAIGEEDEIKEIDEGILSELDTVGDFNVKVVGDSVHDEQILERYTGSHEFDALPNDSSLTEVKPELSALEVRSIEDIDLAFKQIHEGAAVEDQIVVDESEGLQERNSDMQVVEACSLEDIDIAIKHMPQENSVNLSEPSLLEDGPPELNGMSSTKVQPILEVKTIKDIDLAFKQINEGVDIQEVILPSMIGKQLAVDGSLNAGETSSVLPMVSAKELPFLEVKTIEDIDLAFKQIHEGVNIDEIILPSMLEQHLVVDGSRNVGHKSSELQVVEASSLDDIDVFFKQVAQINVGEQKRPLDHKDNSVEGSQEVKSRTLDATEVASSNNIESSTVEVLQTTSTEESASSAVESTVNGPQTSAPLESEQGLDETSEFQVFAHDTKGKKAKSHGSRSSSGSSSSSSDSD